MASPDTSCAHMARTQTVASIHLTAFFWRSPSTFCLHHKPENWGSQESSPGGQTLQLHPYDCSEWNVCLSPSISSQNKIFVFVVTLHLLSGVCVAPPTTFCLQWVQTSNAPPPPCLCKPRAVRCNRNVNPGRTSQGEVTFVCLRT